MVVVVEDTTSEDDDEEDALFWIKVDLKLVILGIIVSTTYFELWENVKP